MLSGEAPALRVGAVDLLDFAEDRHVIKAGEDDLQDPGADRGVDVLGPDDLGDDLKARLLPFAQRPAGLFQKLTYLPARLVDLGLRIAERAAVAGQAEVDLQRLDPVEADEELAAGGGGGGAGGEEDGATEERG